MAVATAPNMRLKPLRKGESWTPVFRITDYLGAAVDLTVAGRDVHIRVSLLDTEIPVINKRKSTPNETDYATNGVDGRIKPRVTGAETAALAGGQYEVEVWYFDTATTPPYEKVIGLGFLLVIDPETGALP